LWKAGEVEGGGGARGELQQVHNVFMWNLKGFSTICGPKYFLRKQ